MLFIGFSVVLTAGRRLELAYSSLADVERVLAQALTSSLNSDTKISLWSIGNQRNTSEISDEVVYQYIRWADDEIDSSLSEMYRVPFHKVSNGEWQLEQDIDEYNPTNVVVSDATNLVPGDEIYIISTAFDPPIKEKHTVATIVDDDEFTVEDAIITHFPAGPETRVMRIGFPVAITLISARLTGSRIFDKYFSSQSSPNVSDYGKVLYGQAISQLTDILNGVVILTGEERLNQRFANANLYDRFQILNRAGNESREVRPRQT